MSPSAPLPARPRRPRIAGALRIAGAVLVTAALIAACRAQPLPDAEAATARPWQPKTGDLVFHQSTSAQSEAIRIATGSRYTHVGVVLLDDGVPVVLEAVQPVKLTPLDAWFARGTDGQAVVRRLADAASVITEAKAAELSRIGRTWLGKGYDAHFSWDDERLYCSELAVKLYERALGITVGKRERIGDLRLAHPAVKRKMKERWGKELPLDEVVVTPAGLFEDERFVTVFER